MISRIDHVSLAVKDYEKAQNFFVALFGAVPGAFADDEHLKYHWRIFSLGDLSRLELLKSTGDGSFLENFYRRNPHGGVHHITLETPDIGHVKSVLEKKDIPFFGYAEYGDVWKELFIHPRDAFGVLIQVAEFRPDDFLDDRVKLPAGKKWSVHKDHRGIRLALAHPGGGTCEVRLTDAEAAMLMEDLKQG